MSGSPSDQLPAPDRPSGVRSPAFRLLWWSWSVSLAGDGLRIIGLPLYVAVYLRNPLAIAAIIACVVMPWALFSLPAGALVDRWRPRTVLVISDGWRGVLGTALVYVVVTDQANVPVLCALGFMFGTAEVFFYPASQTMIVQLAHREELASANARFFSTQTVLVNLLGPVAAGPLFLVSPALLFGIDALSFLVAGLLVLGLPDVAPRGGGAGWRLGETVGGLRIIFRSTELRNLMVAVALAAMASTAVNPLVPLYGVDVLGMATALVPLLFVGAAVGMLAGNTSAPAIVGRIGRRPTMMSSLLVLATGLLLLGTVPAVWAAGLGLAMAGMGTGSWSVVSSARRQEITPHESMGQVANGFRFVSFGAMPISVGLAGPVAAVTSLSVLFTVCGVVVLLAAMVLLRGLVRAPASLTGGAAAGGGASP